MDEKTLPEKIRNTLLVILLIAVITIAILTGLVEPSISSDSGEILRSI